MKLKARYGICKDCGKYLNLNNHIICDPNTKLNPIRPDEFFSKMNEPIWFLSSEPNSKPELLNMPNFQIRIKVKKTDESANVPKYSNKGDSGFDLASIESVTISPGETKLIGTGLSFQIPEGYEMQIRPRSGMSAKTKFRICNSPGTVDSNFRGEVKIIAENTGHRPIFIENGDRIAQGVICPVYEAVFIEEELEETVRGIKGFGSSGVK